MQSVLRNRRPNTKVNAKPQAKKFPLLIYHRYHQVQRGMSFGLAALGMVLAVSGVLLRVIRPGAVSGDVWLLFWVGAVITVFGLARFLLTWAISRTAYVQCTPRNVKIQTPFMPVVFSYKRIAGSRPTTLRDVFPAEKQKGARRKMLEEVWGQTVIVVDLKGYPMSKSFLRTMLGPYLLTPRGTGFVFLVQDWMGLSRQLSDYQEQWRARTSKSVPPAQRGFYGQH
jgi:hypothetical protein